jgi:hypothetical protein
MVDWTWDGDRYADTEDNMHRSQGIDVAIPKEEQAGRESQINVAGVRTGFGRCATANSPAAAVTSPGPN